MRRDTLRWNSPPESKPPFRREPRRYPFLDCSGIGDYYEPKPVVAIVPLCRVKRPFDLFFIVFAVRGDDDGSEFPRPPENLSIESGGRDLCLSERDNALRRKEFRRRLAVIVEEKLVLSHLSFSVLHRPAVASHRTERLSQESIAAEERLPSKTNKRSSIR